MADERAKAADERAKAIDLALAQIEKQFARARLCGWVKKPSSHFRDSDGAISLMPRWGWAVSRARVI